MDVTALLVVAVQQWQVNERDNQNEVAVLYKNSVLCTNERR